MRSLRHSCEHEPDSILIVTKQLMFAIKISVPPFGHVFLKADQFLRPFCYSIFVCLTNELCIYEFT